MYPPRLVREFEPLLPRVSLVLLIFLFSLVVSRDDLAVLGILKARVPPPHVVVDGLRVGGENVFDAAAAASACIAPQVARLKRFGLKSALSSPRLRSHVAGGRPRVALAVPAHAPAFSHVLSILRERAHDAALDWDFFVTFTRTADADAFHDFIESDALGATRLSQLYTPLVAEWWVSPIKLNASLLTYGIVSLKHITALAALRTCYDVIATPDVEILTRPRLGAKLAARAESLENGAVFFGGVSPNGRCNLRRAAEFISIEDVEELRSRTLDFTLTAWFSDAPIYRAGDVAHFLEWKRAAEVTPTTAFLYNSYQFWLMLHRGAKLVDLAVEFGYRQCASLEFLDTEDMLERVVAKYPPGPVWLSAAFCSLLKPVPARCADGDNGPALIFHTDRTYDGILQLPAVFPCDGYIDERRSLPFGMPIDDMCWIIRRDFGGGVGEGERDARDEEGRIANGVDAPPSAFLMDVGKYNFHELWKGNQLDVGPGPYNYVAD